MPQRLSLCLRETTDSTACILWLGKEEVSSLVLKLTTRQMEVASCSGQDANPLQEGRELKKGGTETKSRYNFLIIVEV